MNCKSILFSLIFVLATLGVANAAPFGKPSPATLELELFDSLSNFDDDIDKVASSEEACTLTGNFEANGSSYTVVATAPTCGQAAMLLAVVAKAIDEM